MTPLASLLCIACACVSAAVSSSASARSSSSSSTYTQPICDPDGFYCPGENLGSYTCLPRTDRCAGDASAPLCIQKTYEHCNYIQQSEKFVVKNHATPLAGLPSSKGIGNPLDCLGRKLEHQFIMYRGLMYEFGSYGNRVQDPNDPNYEYRPGGREEKRSPIEIGVSSCTYEEVIMFTKTWDEYQLCSYNCQDFAKGLGEYLTADCSYTRRRKRQSNDDDMATYIYSISGTNCTGNFTVNGADQASKNFAATIIVAALIDFFLWLA